MEQKISKPTKERLIKLVRLLGQLDSQGKETISSAEIQQRTGWTSFTIRRDISVLPDKCSNSSGYKVSALKEEICRYLKLNECKKRCCIVGLGKLGEALINFKGFESSVFEIKAGFDVNVNRTETLRSKFPLYSTSKMETVIRQEGIDFAILAVPENSAQETALRLSAAGIKGIVNYTSAILHLPETTAVQNLSIIDALQNLASR